METIIDECSVCFEISSNKTICNHLVCKECLLKLKKMECPLCRRVLPKPKAPVIFADLDESDELVEQDLDTLGKIIG